MKSKNINKNSTVNSKIKYLKLKLIKAGTYKNIGKENIFLEDISIRLKKALHVIHKYHRKGKKILFVGFTLKLEDKLQRLFNNTRHILLPTSLWMNGILTNQHSSFQYLALNSRNISKRHSHLLFQLRNKADLVVILDSNFSEPILKESKKANIPVICLGSSLNVFDTITTYKVPGFFNSINRYNYHNFFYSLIYSVIKKAQNDRFKSIRQEKLIPNNIYSQKVKNNLKKV